MQPKNPKDIVRQILEQQRLDKADFKGPGMLDQDSFDMPFSLSQEAKNTLNNYFTTVAKQAKTNPEMFSIPNIKEGARLLNSGFATEAQLSKSQLQEELIKALNAEKIEHNLKPIRKKQATGGLQNPEKADLNRENLKSILMEQVQKQKQKNTRQALMIPDEQAVNEILNSYLNDKEGPITYTRPAMIEKGNKISFLSRGKKSIPVLINREKLDKFFKENMEEREKNLTGGQIKIDANKDGEISAEDFAILREKKQEGGMMLDNQMDSMMQEQETPMIDNQMEKMIGDSQVPDEMMEDNYVDFLIDEALSEEEETMLMQELQANPQLSMLFDKVMEVAMEFSGSGPVEGPGTEVSDSIPARLSDGEFVFTAKSVDVIGADNLMSLMKQAEAQADQRQMAQDGGLMEEEDTAMPVQQEPVRQDIRVTKETVDSQAAMQDEEDLVGDEIKKSMLSGRPHVRS